MLFAFIKTHNHSHSVTNPFIFSHPWQAISLRARHMHSQLLPTQCIKSVFQIYLNTTHVVWPRESQASIFSLIPKTSFRSFFLFLIKQANKHLQFLSLKVMIKVSQKPSLFFFIRKIKHFPSYFFKYFQHKNSLFFFCII